ERDGDGRFGHVLDEPDRGPERDPDDDSVDRDGHGEGHPGPGPPLALLRFDQIFFEHALSSRPLGHRSYFAGSGVGVVARLFLRNSSACSRYFSAAAMSSAFLASSVSILAFSR